MKLPISWLKEYVSFDISAEELAEKITMTGLEVESVDSAVNFKGVVVGEVLEREKHPDADKLNVAMVNTGKETLQIVCGAPNLNVGQKVAVALVGAKLGDFVIGKVELRGVESSGMICSEKELGVGEDHNGIMVLDKKAKVGEDFAKYLKAEKVLDIKVFANRSDMMGIEGLAREVAAALNKKFTPPSVVIPAEAGIQVQKEKEIPGLRPGMTRKRIEDLIKIKVEDKKLCPRYVARVVRDVKVTDSPAWMQERLVACGVRPINNIVDISNYVMLETGQPLHFFDLDKLGSAPEIVIRKAKEGEKMVTLDGSTRKLDPSMLLITDKNKPIAIAGVMGGENTEVDATTKNILIEAAVFEKSNIRKTSRLLGLRTEAVARFEKGIVNELPYNTIDRAAQLLAEVAEGNVVSGKIDVGRAQKPIVIPLNPDRVSKFLGVEITKKEIKGILESLGFEVSGEDVLKVETPWWRNDIENETDLIEEVIRIWGYDKLPSTLPKTGSVVPGKSPSFELSLQIRNLLSNIGLTEILTYSFIGGKELEAVGEDLSRALRLENPLVSEQEYLRTSLVPHLLMAIRDNQFNKDSVKFFEIAKSFRKASKGILPREEKQLVVGITGGKSWPISHKEGDNFYNIKGVFERLSKELGLSDLSLKRVQKKELKDGVSAEIFVGKTSIGYFGEVKKSVLDNFDVKKEVGILVLNLDLLYDLVNKIVPFEDFSKYPKVTRDLSVIMQSSVEVSRFEEEILKVSNLIYQVSVMDIYQGKPLEQNQKSVTFRIDLWSKEKTFTDVEVEEIVARCEAVISKLGGEIRSGKRV